MKTEQKIGMSLALATLIALGTTGCGGDSNDSPSVISAVDVTVERGKVYDANVKDSSTPAQVATQKSGENVYTFSKAPTYPVVVTGGWIDVNDDGTMDVNDVQLDIVMKSYSTIVTPVTTVIADTNGTRRQQNLEALVAQLNASGVGSATKVTVEDLLKVPSQAPRDVFVVANAIYKDMKEKNVDLPSIGDVMSQFGTISGLIGSNGTAKELEVKIMSDLVALGESLNVTSKEIADFKKKFKDSQAPTGGSTTTATPILLSGYSSIIIYKNINQTIANSLLGVLSNNSGFKSENKNANCTDFGFTNQLTSKIPNIKAYTDGFRTCIETDYANQPGAGGSANILAYYGLSN